MPSSICFFFCLSWLWWGFAGGFLYEILAVLSKGANGRRMSMSILKKRNVLSFTSFVTIYLWQITDEKFEEAHVLQ